MTTTPLGRETDPITPGSESDAEPEPQTDPDGPPEVPVEPSLTRRTGA